MFPPIRDKYSPDFIIANAENSHEGRGVNRSIVQRLYDLDVDVITGGNHSFDKWKIFSYMKTDENLLRPMNYPKGNAGYGYGIYSVKDSDLKIGVLNLQGRTFMPQIDDPFTTADWALEKIKQETDIVFIDFHAEATSEKMALAHYLDGRVTAVIGTHTHVPTADEHILPGGTAYQSDAGMTGSRDSVIGVRKDIAIEKFVSQLPARFEAAKKDPILCGVLLDINESTGLCRSIERIHRGPDK